MFTLTHNQLKLTQQQIRLAHLPKVLSGFKILQLSDLHFYEYSEPAYYDRVRELVDSLRPDILVLTGDVVHYGNRHIDQAEAFLASLPANITKLAILGNHDYDDGGRGRYVQDILRKTGFQLLKNEHFVFQKEGNRLCFVGLDDLWYGEPQVAGVLAALPNDCAATIALAHNPLLFDPIAYTATPGQIDLVLSGHTHSGHVYIPFLGPIYKKVFRMKYRYGLFEKNGVQLYVTSGVGSAAFYMKKRKIGFPRFRYNTWPEVALLTLQAG